MFDLPNAKRVRRDDLLARSSASRSPSPLPESSYPDVQERLGQLLNLDSLLAPPIQDQPSSTAPITQETNEDEEQEFEFRLFRAPAVTTADTTTIAPVADTNQGGNNVAQKNQIHDGTQRLRIRLRSPTPGAGAGGEGRFVNPFRGWKYYFSAPGLLSGEKKGLEKEEQEILRKRRQFEDVAVSGQEMLGWARVAWPGCHLPWRVIRLKREHTKLPKEPKSTESPVTYILEPEERIPKSRKKPGKKRRIQLRKRAVAAERAKETEAEKRNRKNREKKIKRRQKAREQKAAAAAVVNSEITAQNSVSALEQTKDGGSSGGDTD